MGNSKSTLTLRTNEVFVDVNSGLGNQLFMIAAAYSYCLNNDKKLVLLDNVKYKYWSNILNKCQPFLRPNIYKNIKSHQYYAERSFTYNKLPTVKKNLHMKGYFQSEKYFIQHEKEIRELFELSSELKNFAKSHFKKLLTFGNEILVAVHIRRGDYLKLADKHTIQPISYFNEARQIMINKIGGLVRFVYFSDDPDWVRRKIDLRSRDIVISGLKDYEDFALMQQCHHFIITNSTFSWWAAWLSESFKRYLTIPNNILLKDIKVNEKIVIAPSEWFGVKGPKEWNTIYPENWIVLNSKPKPLGKLFHLCIMANEKTVDIDRRQFTDKNIPFRYNFFIGDCTKDDTEKVIKLKEPDSSTSLFTKMQQVIKWTLETYHDIEYIIIANENAKFNFDAFSTYATYVYTEHMHYAGMVVNVDYGKCCSNDCFFLSRQAASFILKYVSVDDKIKEGEKLGYCLNRVGIHPIQVDIHKAIYA